MQLWDCIHPMVINTRFSTLVGSQHRHLASMMQVCMNKWLALARVCLRGPLSFLHQEAYIGCAGVLEVSHAACRKTSASM
jgi:hypothetical protein